MEQYQLKPIGTVRNDESGTWIVLEPEYIPGLEALEGFSHINVIWWFSGHDREKDRSVLLTEKPYRDGPEVMGVFATRSPLRPNPIALTAAEIIHTDQEKGLIRVTFLDADNGTPVLDIKPYTPSLDRVETPGVPVWCSKWPKSTEESGYFDWGQVFNFYIGGFMKLQDYMDKKPVLETGQLILRPLQVSDVADLKEWMGAPSLYQYWGKRPGKGDLNPELLFQKKEKPTKSFHWGIVHKKDDKVVGEMWVYLIEKDRMAKVAFRLSPAYQGKGLMAEALAKVVVFCFEETQLQRLWSDVHIQNIASYKTLEKAGFRREGHIHEGKMVNTWCDYYLYGMTKADYAEIVDKGLDTGRKQYRCSNARGKKLCKKSRKIAGAGI